VRDPFRGAGAGLGGAGRKVSSTEINIDRDDFVVAKESDIMGVVE